MNELYLIILIGNSSELAAERGLKEVPASALAWLNDQTIDKTTSEAQALIKAIFMFSKMTSIALVNDPSYKGKMSLAGIKMDDVQATLLNVAENCKQQMCNVSRNIEPNSSFYPAIF